MCGMCRSQISSSLRADPQRPAARYGLVVCSSGCKTPPPNSAFGRLALLIGFVVLAQPVGLETILGAFMAGVIVAALDPDTITHPRFRAKLEGIGYGFVVPVFFITSGLQLELHQLFASPLALLRVLCSWSRFSSSEGCLPFSISGRSAFGRPRRPRYCRPLHCRSLSPRRRSVSSSGSYCR